MHDTEKEGLMYPAYSKDKRAFGSDVSAVLTIGAAHHADTTQQPIAKELLAYYEAHTAPWVPKEREALIATLKAYVGPTPAAAPTPAAPAVAFAETPKELKEGDRPVWVRSVEAFRAGKMKEAWEAGAPLFNAYPKILAVQDLRCQIAMKVGFDWQKTKAECEQLMQLTMGKQPLMVTGRPRPGSMAVMLAALTLAAATSGAEPSRLTRVLEYGAEIERDARTGSAITVGVIGGFAIASGATLVIVGDRDGSFDRRVVGSGLISGGIGAVLGGLLMPLISPAGEHEKLLISIRANGSTADVEAKWAERAEAARSLRTGFGIFAFAVGAAGFVGGTLMMLREPSRQRDSYAAILFSFGIVESLLGGIIMATPSPIEMSHEIYRRSTALSRARPIVVTLPGGAIAGLSVQF